MADRCDGCGREVSIAGGISTFWTFGASRTDGMTLEFDADGSEHFLCFDCVELLPDDPTAADVAALSTRAEDADEEPSDDARD